MKPKILAIGSLFLATVHSPNANAIPTGKWKADTIYQPGDIVAVEFMPDIVFRCREPPFGDFCRLSPNSHGGSTAWERIVHKPKTGGVVDDIE